MFNEFWLTGILDARTTKGGFDVIFAIRKSILVEESELPTSSGTKSGVNIVRYGRFPDLGSKSFPSQPLHQLRCNLGSYPGTYVPFCHR